MLAPLVQAVTMIYPVDAINDLWQLPAEEFRQKYAGINVSGLGPSDEGWYVRYRHENLTYLFGPLADREEARKRKWDMETVRDAAIRNRASLASSQVDFVRFTFSSVYGKGGGGQGGGGQAGAASGLGRISADGRSGPDGDLDGDGIPNAQDPDMDGDGIPNELDDDVDGDGIPNAQDDYGYGTMDAKIRAGTGLGAGGGAGEGGEGEAGRTADRNNGKGGKGGRGGQGGGESGQGGQGGDGGESGQIVGSQGGLQQVASTQRGGFGGQQGGTGGQGGQQGGQSGQQGGQSGQSGASGQQGGGQQGGGSSGGQAGGGGAPGGGGQPGGGSSGGGGNPLQLVSALLRLILGI